MARITSGNGDQDARADGGGTRGPEAGYPGAGAGPAEFETELDYGAYPEEDGATGSHTADTEAMEAQAMDTQTTDTEAMDARAVDTGARGGVTAGTDTGSTQAIDRGELDRLAARDAGGAGRDTDGVVTATAEPEPTSAWSTGPGVTPAPVTREYRGFDSGTLDPEERRRELRGAEARAAARDEALEGPSTAPRVLQVLLALLFPVVVLIAAVRLVASPVFLWLEYHRPGFPADPNGFTTDDRLTYGSAGMDYLFNAAPPRYLGDLQHQGSALFTDGEVGHMADVKLVMLVTMAVGVVLALLCVVFMVMLSRTAKGGIRRSLFAGSVWMLLVLAALAVLAVLGWEQFFAGFHSLFFADGTWTFRSTDALIRLYPGVFWMDAGIAVAALVLVTLVVVLVCTWPTRRRRHESRLAQEDLIRRRNDWADVA